MKIKADLHIHTAYSDGRGTIREVVAAAKKAGLDAIAITDHNTSKGYFIARRIAENLIVIPGFEATTTAGHVIVLGVVKRSDRKLVLPYEELIERVEELGGVTILAHPAIHARHLKKWIQCKPTAVEVINALYPLPKIQTHISMKIAKKLNRPTTAGSDAHQPNQTGKAYITIEVNKPAIEEILEAIRKGKTVIGGSFSPLKVRIISGLNYMISSMINATQKKSLYRKSI